MNPQRPSAAEIYREVERTKVAPNRGIADGVYSLRRRYDRRWHFGRDHDYTFEQQAALLVASDGPAFRGYFNSVSSVLVPYDGDGIYLTISAEMLYVLPAYRGNCYSIDLSVAAGWMVRELLRAVYWATPARNTLHTTLRADLVSTGGQHFVEKLIESLEYEIEILTEENLRPSLHVEKLDFDGGW